MRTSFYLDLLIILLFISCDNKGYVNDSIVVPNVEEVDFHSIDMYNIINTGIHSNKYSLGQIFCLSHDSIVYAKGDSNCEVLIALGDDAMMLGWGNPDTRMYLSEWSDKEISVDNAEYGAKYAFVLFGNKTEWPITRDYLANHCSLIITDVIPFSYHILTGCFDAKAIAHRGIHVNGIPENSLLSYSTAARCGMDMVEADVCVTKDRKYVMSHNTRLCSSLVERVDGTALTHDIPISSITLDQIQSNYRLKSTIPEYTQIIPSLIECLIVCRDHGIFAFLEIKSENEGASFSPSEAMEVCDLCQRILGNNNFCIQSMNHNLLDYIRSKNDEVNLCYMYKDIRGTYNYLTGNSRFTKYTHTMLFERDLSNSLVKAYKDNGSWVFDGDLATPTTMSDVIQSYNGPFLVGNVCGPNLIGRIGIKRSSTKGWYDFTHTGSFENGNLKLASGQYLAVTAPIVFLGGQMIKLKFNGRIRIKTSYNDSIEVDSSNFDEYYRRDLIYTNFGGYFIVAETDTVIEYLDYEFAEC